MNLVAGWFVWHPLGGSAADLEQEAANLRSQLVQRRSILQKTRLNVTKVESGRAEGDQFMQGYFLSRRTAAATIIGELSAAARESKIRTKVHSFNEEPIEGTDTLNMMIITGEYEGTYADLIAFVNRIDRSPRLLIIESLTASPQQGTNGLLNIGVKLDAFVREDSGLPVTMSPSASDDTSVESGPPASVQGAATPSLQNSAAPPANPAQASGAPPRVLQQQPPGIQMRPNPQPQSAPPPITVQPGDAERPSARGPVRGPRRPRQTEEEQQ